MTIFDPGEKVEFIAMQSLHYDRYSHCQYFLERICVDGKYGLICEEVVGDTGTHARILLQPIYKEIQIRKISSEKAIYNKYEVFANGHKVGIFTFVLNAWVPVYRERSHLQIAIAS